MAPTVVAISGPSGSGKSSLVRAVEVLLPDVNTIYFDDYKDSTKFPDDWQTWLKNGCNPNDFVTPKMVEDLSVLRNQMDKGWIIVEEPFGRGREGMSDLVDFVVCIDISPEIAFARTIKRAAIMIPEDLETSIVVKSIIDFVDQYLNVNREAYAIINDRVKLDCDLIVDGTREINVLAMEICNSLMKSLAGK